MDVRRLNTSPFPELLLMLKTIDPEDCWWLGRCCILQLQRWFNVITLHFHMISFKLRQVLHRHFEHCSARRKVPFLCCQYVSLSTAVFISGPGLETLAGSFLQNSRLCHWNSTGEENGGEKSVYVILCNMYCWHLFVKDHDDLVNSPSLCHLDTLPWWTHSFWLQACQPYSSVAGNEISWRQGERSRGRKFEGSRSV